MIDQTILDRLATVQPTLDAAAAAIRAALATKGYETATCYLDNKNVDQRWSALVRVKGAKPFTMLRDKDSSTCEFGKTPQEAFQKLMAVVAALPDPGAHDAEMDWRILREFEERRAGA
jgi:hypothetical protein